MRMMINNREAIDRVGSFNQINHTNKQTNKPENKLENCKLCT